ncbi:hypothetical protein KKE26_09990 [bacterium]|nr:hypothetical protein [bacterium]
MIIASKFGAKRLILFGSAVESPETVRDLDIAYDGVEISGREPTITKKGGASCQWPFQA